MVVHRELMSKNGDFWDNGDLSMENVESTRKTCGFMGYTRDNNAVNLTANN